MEFKAVRDGRVRILLGLIAKLGIGTNLQTRLCALPHLDAPWRPCDVEPREGRILRQGNQCEDGAIFGYVTEGSFDSYRWQTLETKARSIAQVMKGDKGIRSLEDVALAALSSAAVKALASGNPLVIKKAGVDAEAARLSTLSSVWRDQRYANESEVSRLPMMIKAQQRPTRDELRAGGREIEQLVGRFGGNALGVQATRGEEVPSLYLSGACLYSATPYQTGPALVAAPVDLLASIPK